MEKKILPFLVLLLAIFIIVPAYGTNHYVDKNASGSNNGSSWSNAWESFGAINWSNVNPGDTVWISGGTDSIVYNETLTLSKSGTSGQPIVVARSNSAGHNGEVIIDAGGIRDLCIDPNADYVTVSGFRCRGAVGSGDAGNGVINVLSQNYVTIENCSIYVSLTHGGIYSKYSDHLTVRGCEITTSSYTDVQTDGMFIQHASNLMIEHNRIIISNGNLTPHCDVMQLDDNDNGIVRYNYLEQDNNKTTNAQGIYISNGSGGKWEVYGNILVSHDGHNNGMIILGSGDATAYLLAYNNTLVGGNNENGQIRIVNCDGVGSQIKNNIVVSTHSGGSLITAPSTVDRSNIVNNILWNGSTGSNIISYGGNYYTRTSWINSGGSSTIKDINPMFINPGNKDFRLQNGSEGIDNGNNLNSPYNQDIMGITRPQGQNYDMGAYEYTNGNPNPDTTPPEVTGAELLDSMTVIVHFSEEVSEATAENSSNYSIEQNIGITSASLSSNGMDVTLTTDIHLVGPVYSVTVMNVQDLAGNTVSNSSNSAQYQLIVTPEGDLNQLNIVGAVSSAWYQNYVPPLSIDGISDTSSDSRWAGAVPMPDTITFDLGELKLIKQSKFSFYRWDQGRIYHYSVFVSSDNINWFNAVTNAPSGASQWAVITFYPVVGRYIRLISIDNNESSFAGVWEAEIWGSATPVPVELTSFTAEQMNNSVVIKWSTATETNNKGFEVQKKVNGEYKVIGFVGGHGTTTKPYSYKFNDNEIEPGELTYRIRQVDFDGAFEYSDDITVSINNPAEFELSQNYPNPFNPTTRIRFSIPFDNHVKLTLYNLLGEKVRDIIDKDYKAGIHEISLDASRLSSGVYLYKIETQNYVNIKKMMVMK